MERITGPGNRNLKRDEEVSSWFKSQSVCVIPVLAAEHGNQCFLINSSLHVNSGVSLNCTWIDWLLWPHGGSAASCTLPHVKSMCLQTVAYLHILQTRSHIIIHLEPMFPDTWWVWAPPWGKYLPLQLSLAADAVCFTVCGEQVLLLEAADESSECDLRRLKAHSCSTSDQVGACCPFISSVFVHVCWKMTDTDDATLTGSIIGREYQQGQTFWGKTSLVVKKL